MLFLDGQECGGTAVERDLEAFRQSWWRPEVAAPDAAMTGMPPTTPARGRRLDRVLILSASASAGHVRAAQALEKAFQQSDTPQAVVVTDFDVHAMWLVRHVERYFVALEETRVHLARLGIPEDRITVSGIPIDPVFAEPKDAGHARTTWARSGPHDDPGVGGRVRRGARRAPRPRAPPPAPPGPGGHDLWAERGAQGSARRTGRGAPGHAPRHAPRHRLHQRDLVA